MKLLSLGGQHQRVPELPGRTPRAHTPKHPCVMSRDENGLELRSPLGPFLLRRVRCPTSSVQAVWDWQTEGKWQSVDVWRAGDEIWLKRPSLSLLTAHCEHQKSSYQQLLWIWGFQLLQMQHKSAKMMFKLTSRFHVQSQTSRTQRA